MSWKTRPHFIDEIPYRDNIDWLIFIDESGNDELKHIKRNIQNNTIDQIENSAKRMVISACAIRMSVYPDIGSMITKLKCSHWPPKGLYSQNGLSRKVCLHGKEINRHENAFSSAIINTSNFTNDLNDFMSNLQILLLASVVDKVRLCQRYSKPFDPYEISLEFIFERLFKYYLRPDERATIIFEKRGKKEDKNLHRKVMSIINKGTQYSNPSHYLPIQGVYFNPKLCAANNNQTSYYGLEIADLCAYTIYKSFLLGTPNDPYKIIRRYFYGYPDKIQGRGLIYFPSKD